MEARCLIQRNAEGKWETILESDNGKVVLLETRNANKAQDLADKVNAVLGVK